MRILLNTDPQPGLLTEPPKELTEPFQAPSGIPVAAAENPQPVDIKIQPAPQNDTAATTGNSDKGGLREAISKATAAISDGAKSIFKKSRGRWRKCRACDGQPGNFECEQCKGTGKLPNKNDAPAEGISGEGLDDDETQTDLPGTRPPVGENNSEGGNRFRRSVSSSVKSLYGILGAVVAGYADASEIDPDFTDKAIAKAMPSDEDIKNFNDDLDAVLKKRNIQPENCEEWALAINGLKMAAPFAVLIFEFRRELRRKRKEGK